MRPEIDLYVMQDMGEIARGELPAVETVSLELEALLEALRATAANGEIA